MPREKKQRLKRRADGRYACRYKDQWFYSADPDEALAMREEYKRLEKIKASEPVRVSEFADGFLARTKTGLRERTAYEHKIHLDKLLKSCGNLFLPEVMPSHIKDIFSSEYAGLSDSYIKHARSLYVSFFAAAMEDGLCSSNPAQAKSAKPHKGTAGSHRAITPQERTWIDTLCTDHPLFPAVMAMLYAGLRPQEAKAMNIDKSIDVKKQEVHVRSSIHHTGKNLTDYQIDDHLKTEKSTRTVPLFPPLENAIKDKHGPLVPCEKLTEGKWTSLWRSYKTHMETAINGISHKKYLAMQTRPPWISFTVKPYDLRHSFVTWCRDHHVELHTVIVWVGHADSSMVLKIYDEVSQDRSRQEAEKLLKSAFRSHSGSQAKNKKSGSR